MKGPEMRVSEKIIDPIISHVDGLSRVFPRLLVEADSIRRLERLGLAARDRERPFAEALTLSR